MSLANIGSNCVSGGYFGLVFATPLPCVERFSALTLSEVNYTS